jgi:hypothetical protein
VASNGKEKDVANRLAEFINAWPLYSPFDIEFDPPVRFVPDLPRTILRECGHCEATPTWERRNPAQASDSEPVYVGEGQAIAYTCTHCGKETTRVWFEKSGWQAKVPEAKGVVYSRVRFRKFGQWPPKNIEPSRDVIKALDEAAADLLKKGLTSLAHGYGLGALGYFRFR